MARTVVALYDNFQDANSAVRELVENGFKREDISLMAGDQKGEYSRYLSGANTETPAAGGDDVAAGASQGAGVGASIGAALGGIGGLLVGLGALVIPGIGPVLAAGPLAAALAGLAGAGAGALAGGIAGGLIGALVDFGVPEETARYYSEGVHRGGTLVTVRTEDNMSGRAVNIMNTYNPVDINSRVQEWREQGWTGFDSTVQHDASRDYESTGSVRSTVDTELESTEERYGEEQNIPATGDYDRTFGSGRATGPGFSGEGGQNVSSGSRGTEYDTTGDREGEMHPDMPRGEDANAGNRESRLGASAADYNSTRMSDRDSDITGMADTDYSASRGYHDFSYYENDFRAHFNQGVYGATYSYDQYQPVYRYGYDLATDPRYSSRTWEDIEPEARRYWEDREPGAWERFKDSVRHAWVSVRNAVD